MKKPLFSVLEGDMSLVGPRPAFRHELARYEFWHKRKRNIRPGIACLWQIRGRNKISNFGNDSAAFVIARSEATKQSWPCDCVASLAMTG